MRILVIGAGGLLGSAVTQALIDAGHVVTMLARSQVALQARFPAARAVLGDLRNVATIAPALRDVDAVYLSLSVRPDEREAEFHTETDGINNLLAALPGTPVRRIVYLSSLVQRYLGHNGFDWWVFRVKQAALRQLAAAPIATTIFYPSNFMESVADQSTMGRAVMVATGSQVANYYIAAADYAAQVVAALARSVTTSEHYVVQGPQALTQAQAAQQFVQHAQRRYLVVPVPWLALRLASHTSVRAHYGRHIIEAVSNYPEVFEAQATWDLLGRPTTTMAMFAARYHEVTVRNA
jgi:uncharacterized protein YbjT (DUF2867 family)